MVAACFLVSGFAALLYETVWLRQFAILLGTSEQALAIILACYMGGLALGAWVASRYVDAIGRPLLTYGILELGIAVTALSVPWGLSVARSLQIAWLGGLPDPPPSGTASQMVFSFSVAVGLILIPTSLMGATLPLLARHVVHRDDQLGPRIGWLYAINTAGAVLGTLVAAFVLMPTVGMGATTWAGAAANVLVFALVLWGTRSKSWSVGTSQSNRLSPITTPTSSSHASSDPSDSEPFPPSEPAKPVSKVRRRKRAAGAGSPSKDARRPDQPATPRYSSVLGLIAVSGAISFCYEIVFTRMLSHQLGGSVFAFATMLSGFLLGIAVGGAGASRLAKTRWASSIGFAHAQVAAAICTVFAYHWVDVCARWPWLKSEGATTTMVQVGTSILILLPTATCIGLAFPFAIRTLARDESEAATASAKIYSLSTFGGIVGALGTGAVILPALQYHGATLVAIVGNLTVAAVAMVRFRLPKMHGLSIAAGLAVLMLGLPTVPENTLRISALGVGRSHGPVVFNQVGQSATVTVFYEQGDLRFQTNGLPESSVPGRGSGNQWRDGGRWLSTLPPALREKMDSMMIIGLGGGVAASAVPPSVKSIDVVELSPSVIEANRAVAGLRDNNPLADPRIRLIVNDARNALALTNRQYDCIVSQPSHPWTAGASHLYTREFAEIVGDHLQPGGIFLQWMGTAFIDESLLGSMCATLLDRFDYVRIYRPHTGIVLLVSSDKPIEPESLPTLPIASVDRLEYQRQGLDSPTNLLACLAADVRGVRELARGAAMIRDDRNLLAMRAPRLTQANRADDNERQIDEVLLRVSPFAQGAERIRQLCPTAEPFGLAQRLVAIGLPNVAKSYLVPLIVDPDRRNLMDHWITRHQAAGDRDQAAGGPDPSNRESSPWLDHLRDSVSTNDPLTAFFLLHVDALGKIEPLSEADRQRLESVVSDRHRRLLPIIRAGRRNQWEPSRRNDEFLASIPTDDMAFPTALMLRIPWRLDATGSERGDRYREALRLIDDHGAFLDFNAVAYFRAIAAIRSGQSIAALATANQVAESMLQTLGQPGGMGSTGGKPSNSARNTIERLRSLLADPSLFQDAPPRQYEDVRLKVQTVARRMEW